MAASVLTAGCDESSDKDAPTPPTPPGGTEDTANPPQPEAPEDRFLHRVYEHVDLDVPAAGGSGTVPCMPPPRRHAQLAYFFEPLGSEGVHYGNGPVMQRGFFMYGGEDDNGQAMDDLWVFDLSRRFQQACDWTLLHGAATGGFGVSDGALVYQDGLLHLVGGREQTSAGWINHFTVDTLDVLGGGVFVIDPYVAPAPGLDGIELEAGAWVEGSDECAYQGYYDCVCADAGGCDIPVDYQSAYQTDFGKTRANEGDPLHRWLPGQGTEASFRTAVCDEMHLDWGLSGPQGPIAPNWRLVAQWQDDVSCTGALGDACALDPLCTSDFDVPSGADVGARAACEGSPSWLGLSSAAWAWDPLSERLMAHGGSVGCEGGECASLFADCDPLLLDGATNASGHVLSSYGRHTLNGRETHAMVPPSFLDVASTMGGGFEEVGVDAFGSPVDGGVRGASGAVVCADWTLAGSISGAATCNPEYIMWGGTTEQSLQPFQHYDTFEGFHGGGWARAFDVVDPVGEARSGEPNSVVRTADASLSGSWAVRRLDESMGYQGASFYLDHGLSGGVGGSDCNGFAVDFDDPSDYAEGWSGSLAALGDSHMVAMGGYDGSGTLRDDITITRLGDCRGTVAEHWDAPAVVGHGAASVYDPVEQRAWFYGAMAGGDLHWVEDAQSRPRRITTPPAEVSVLRLEQEVELVGPGLKDGPWTFRTGMEIVIQWDPSPAPGEALPQGEAFGQRLWLRVPMADAWTEADVATQVKVTLRSSQPGADFVELELDPNVGFVSGQSDGSPLAFFSPFVLPTGAYEVVVEVVGRLPVIASKVEGGAYAAVGTCPASEWAELQSMVAVPWHAPPGDVAEEDWAGPAYLNAFAFTRYVGLNWDVGVVSAGRWDPGCAVSVAQILGPAGAGDQCVDQSHHSGLGHLPGHAAFLMEDLQFYGGPELAVSASFAPGVQATWHVDGWQDLCLGANETAAFGSFMNSDVEETLEALDERLGLAVWNDTIPLTVTDTMVVARRPRPASPTGSAEGSEAGYQLKGQVHMVPFLPDGELVTTRDVIDLDPTGVPNDDYALRAMRNVFAHEQAHAFLDHADLPPWASEGLPQVLAWSLDWEAHQFGMMDGLIDRVGAWIDEKEPLWERVRRPGAPAPSEMSVPPTKSAATNQEELRAIYEVAPYLISQAIAGHHGADDDAFWSAVQDTVQRVGRSPTWADEPRRTPSDADWQALLGAVYSERIQYPSPGSPVGEPLLSMQDLSLPGGSTAAVTVRQVQEALLTTDQGTPFGRFSEVPYALGCSVLDANHVASSTMLAFSQCHTTARGPNASQAIGIGVLNAESETLSLTAAPGVDVSTSDVPVPGSTQAVAFTLFAHHLLWPGVQGEVLRGSLRPSKAMAGPFSNDLPSHTKVLVTLEGRTGTEKVPNWVDGDGDGFAPPTDCADADASVFPGNSNWPVDGSGALERWVSTDRSGVNVSQVDGNQDLDCDGWPIDFWRMLEAK